MTRTFILSLTVAALALGLTACDTTVLDDDLTRINENALPPFVAFGTLTGPTGTVTALTRGSATIRANSAFRLPVELSWGFGDAVNYTVEFGGSAVRGTDYTVTSDSRRPDGSTSEGAAVNSGDQLTIAYPAQQADFVRDFLRIRPTATGVGKTIVVTITGASSASRPVTAGRMNVATDATKTLTISAPPRPPAATL